MKRVTGTSLWVVAAVLAGAIATGAHAETQQDQMAATSGSDAAADADSGEIIVTAQKRSERLRDVPVSITAVSGDQLARQRITRAEDLERIVPGFTSQSTGYGGSVFAIRGIGFFDTALTVSPAVTIYLDQVPLPYSIEAAGVTLDLERLEALKGPQGTLFGQNSTGGAINYVAAKPTADFRAGASLTYGRFNQIELEGFVSGPVSETVSVRAAGRYERADGWQRSYTRNAELGERDFLTGRFLVDWTPSSTVSFELSVNGWRDHSETQAAQYLGYAPTTVPGRAEQAAVLPTYPLAPTDIRSADWDANTDLRRDDSFYQIALRGEIELADWATLNTITAWMDYRADTPTDPDGTAFLDIYAQKLARLKTFYQELRVSGKSGPVRLTVGGNVQIDRTRENQETLSLGSNQQVGPFPFTGFSLNNRQQIDTLAGFAAVDWDLSAKLTLQGAIRYTDQNHGFDGCIEDRGGGLARAFSFLSSNLTGTAVTIAPGSCVTLNAANFPAGRISRQLNENNTSWRVSLNYKPNDDVLLYANATKGYKSGSFPLVPAVSEPQLTPVVQESLMAFEAGFKAALADNAVSISGAGFYYQYKNKQIFGYVNTGFPFGNLPGLVNVPDSSVTGAELELLLRPTTALRVSLGATYIDSKVDKTFLTPDPFANIVDIRGEAFPNTPKWQFVGDAEYGFDVATDTRIYLGGSVRYRSSSYAAFGRNPQFVIEDYALVDLRAGAEFGRFRAEIWGRNVTNQRYITQAAHIIDTVGVFTGPPATYGLTLGYKW